MGRPVIFKQVENTVFATSDQNKAEKLIYTRGLWDSTLANLKTFFTSSNQNAKSKSYYYEVWSSASLDCNDVKMFSVAYGNKNGSGSLNEGGEVNDTPSRAVYSQYKLSCLDGDESGFYISGSSQYRAMNHFYAININRDKFGDKLDPGNFELSLVELSGSGYSNNYFTGSKVQVSSSNRVITLIDDSNDAGNKFEFSGQPSIARNVVSGTLKDGVYISPAGVPISYGLVFPDRGVILLDADVLNRSASFNTVTGSNVAGDNAMKLFTSISGAAAVANSGFTARAMDIKNQQYVFVRINNGDFNYSNNPTYVTASTAMQDKGIIREDSFKEYPYTYITTVGLYNDLNELIAVGKMSKPVLKSPTSELSITVKLEY